MLLRTLTLENFGIYGGVHHFDLAPASSGQFDRPIVLISGKNGAGKTTFVEAIRLCLHGRLALGARVGQQEYEDYLRRRIHRPTVHPVPHPAALVDSSHAAAEATAQAAVALSFDFVSLGKQQHYRVRRSWRTHQQRLQHELCIWENDIELDMLTPAECETLLRELAPPGLTGIFFFDGEKIDLLAQESGSHELLAETVHELLGLNLIEQLQRDLDLFLARRSGAAAYDELQETLSQQLAAQAELEQRRDSAHAARAELQGQLDGQRERIDRQEMRLAAAGGSYAERRQQLLQRRGQVEAEIEARRRQASELASGLLPFAVAPAMLAAVRSRLEQEQHRQEEQAARQMIDRQLDVLRGQGLAALPPHLDGARNGAGPDHAPTPDPLRRQILDEVIESLRRAVHGWAEEAGEPVLPVSAKERAQLLQWIDAALEQTPRAFSRVAQALQALERERSALNDDLARAPADDEMGPLAGDLHTLLRELGRLEQRQQLLRETEESAVRSLEHITAALERTRAALEAVAPTGQRSRLAFAARRVLDDYRAELSQRKLALLEHSLVSHFNQLCRKHAFVDRIAIDLDTFALRLERAGHVFGREQLSAGENQLLAIAILWSLRELSGRAMPVVIDTPLSRLDSQHRQRMLHDFFPRASHQVLLLATDAEIDDAAQRLLAPVISHIYHIEYDPATGATSQRRETPQARQANLPLFDAGEFSL